MIQAARDQMASERTAQDAIAAEFVRDRREDFAKAAREAAEAQGELSKAVTRTDLPRLTARVDGYVQ
jgi:hypothetical protein